jgi:hypothetical protein
MDNSFYHSFIIIILFKFKLENKIVLFGKHYNSDNKLRHLDINN